MKTLDQHTITDAVFASMAHCTDARLPLGLGQLGLAGEVVQVVHQAAEELVPLPFHPGPR